MEQVLSKLSEIETHAQQIMEDTAQKKIELTEEMEKNSKAFDSVLARETSEKVALIRQKLEADKEQQLAALRTDTEAQLASMKAYYEQNHDSLVQEIFDKILEN